MTLPPSLPAPSAASTESRRKILDRIYRIDGMVFWLAEFICFALSEVIGFFVTQRILFSSAAKKRKADYLALTLPYGRGSVFGSFFLLPSFGNRVHSIRKNFENSVSLSLYFGV